MLKVLIVDDEQSIRECMPYVIEWEKYGFEIAYKASNGVDALKIIKEEKPDLVITDIKMPAMDGLELIEKTRELPSDIKFIILSGYDDFEYAKKAMEYRASGYLLKPVEEDELIGLLEQVKRDITSQRNNHKVYMNHIIRIMTSGNYTEEMLPANDEERLLRSQTELYYISAEIDDEEEETSFGNARTSCEDEILSQMSEIVCEYIGEDNNFCIHKSECNSLEMVVWGDLLREKKRDISSFANDLQQQFRLEIDKKISILVGAKVDSCYNLYESAKSIDKCRKYKFYSRPGTNLEYDKVKNNPFCNVLEDTTAITELVQATIKAVEEDIGIAVDKLCDEMRAENLLPDSVKIYTNSLTMDLMCASDELGGSKESILLKFNMLNRLNNPTLMKVNAFLKKQCIETGKVISSLRHKRFTGIIGEVVDYIYENYEKDIKLSKISEQYHFNTCYLGQLFKKKVGVNFNTFLIGVRITKAKKLLLNSDMKIFEISDKVGFKDSNYFCVKFMEFEKMSPSRYRRENSEHGYSWDEEENQETED